MTIFTFSCLAGRMRTHTVHSQNDLRYLGQEEVRGHRDLATYVTASVNGDKTSQTATL